MRTSKKCGCKTPALDRYLEKLPITPKNLSGKIVLELGAVNLGADGMYFAEEATIHCRTKVFCVDKNFNGVVSHYADLTEMVRSHNTSIPRLDALKICLKRSVWALAQELPFRDNIFDILISHFAIPMVLDSLQDIVNSLRNAIRVLKPGGAAYLYPLIPLRHSPYCEIDQKRVYRALQMLTREKGIKITLLPCREDDPIGSGLKIPTQLLIIQKTR
ncbi:MAG: methyltransferase domain-containing protein [Candidatus Sungbacteria bacterium]|nr:methyltransferase domain-containing protein [Candidatus Sungbacteria bacterium]